jgi:hypothetical protein
MISYDGGKNRADIRAWFRSQGLLKGTIGVVTWSVHLDLGGHKARAVLNHLLPQAFHQARNEQQHGVAQGNGSHRD